MLITLVLIKIESSFLDELKALKWGFYSVCIHNILGHINILTLTLIYEKNVLWGFLQVFSTTLSDHYFNISLESVMLGHESGENIWFSFC
jgi:hypothetical protein